MGMLRSTVGLFALAALVACGGSKPKPAAPAASAASDEPVEEEDTGPPMISQDKLDAVNGVFTRKEDIIGRCYAKALEDGELGKNAKGYATVGLTVTTGGKPSDVRILETTLKSQELESCIVSTVQGWGFPKLPSPLQTSYTYNFERDY